jgi:DNA-binding NarL/FixJ family response regulator
LNTALIVENFRPIAEVWELTLKSMGFNKITIVENELDYNEYLKQNDPDLVLMDINLPDSVSGIDLTKQIQKSDKSTKVIIVSLHDEPHFLHKSLEAGANGYIVKTSPLTELKKGIEKVLSGELFICEKMKHYLNP